MTSPLHPTISLRKLRRLGLNLAEISRACGCNRTTLDRLLKGERHSDPPREIVERLTLLLSERTRASH
ncbi:MAG: hypothetical protein AAAB35_15260 [Phyllobacterium sp.]|uniref:hypothetical protein n=1 Tax=Phyllobacterium sp. TaxID=1871046 RepID=UPI0030F10EDF